MTPTHPDGMTPAGDPAAPAAPAHVGERLRQAREAAGKTLADIASQTKVPARLLAAIEAGTIEDLPSGPYAIGFARSFARAVGISESETADAVRLLQQQRSPGAGQAFDHYEPADVNRVPPRTLAWTTAAIAVALIAGYAIWRTTTMQPDAAPSPTAPAAQTSAPAAGPAAPRTAAAPIDENAAVVLRATGQVWFGLNDASGRLAFERTLNAGESYVVTPEQRGYTLRTGRAQVLALSVGGQPLPPLGPPDALVKDVALDTASLTRRLEAGAQPAASPTVQPAPVPATARP